MVEKPELQHVSATLPSFLSALSDGVRDFAVPQTPSGRHGSAHVGIRSFVGPIHVDFLAEALAMISTPTELEFPEVSVNPSYILAQAWRSDRLHTSRWKLHLDEKAPRVELNEIRYDGLPTYYSVLDGNHRTTAARLVGKQSIEAILHRKLRCEPHAFMIEDAVLIPMTEQEPLETAHRMGRSMVDLLEALGVQVTHRFSGSQR